LYTWLRSRVFRKIDLKEVQEVGTILNGRPADASVITEIDPGCLCEHISFFLNLQECQEENAMMRSELPLPFVVYYDGWGQMSSSREKNNHEKQTPKRRSKDKKQHQARSQGFYDEPRHEDCDRLFQPPPETPKRRSKDKKQHQAGSQGFYDEPRHEDCDRLFQPPPETPKLRSKNKKQHQARSQGFYDEPKHGDCDMDWRLFQPPPEKIRKTDDDVRRGESPL